MTSASTSGARMWSTSSHARCHSSDFRAYPPAGSALAVPSFLVRFFRLLALFLALMAGGSAALAQIQLAWNDNSTNEAGFRIERADGVGGSFATLATVAADVVTYTDTTVGAFSQYSYRVYAYNDAGDSPVSNTLTINPPTISTIAAQSTNEDTPLGPISFTINDIGTPAGSLTVTATSNNQTIVPNANISLGGSGTNRTITVTPAANKNGSVVITVVVNDGTLSASTSFNLTIAPVNDAPTITLWTPVNRAINEDTSLSALSFTIADAETAASSLTVTASSSDTTVVPDTNITLGGTGSSRTIAVTPAANKNGPVTITLTVSDGVLQTTVPFVLTVNPVNDAPTISTITNQSTNEDTPIGPINFTIDDIDGLTGLTLSVSSNSNTTLIPNGNVVFGGTGNNRTLTITPAANQSGTANLTVRVSDGTAVAQTSFTVTVAAVNDPPQLLTSVGTQTTSTGVAVGPLTFTISDVETSASSLTLTKSSSNTTLVPLANIVLAGTGSTRTVTVTPAPSQTGTTTIIIGISDGTATTNMSFDVVVTGTNTAPTISSISNLSTNEDTATAALAFTIGDAETSPSSLNIAVSSSNLTLVPFANIVVTGTGASRFVTVTPATNQSGTANITLTVSDGASTASTTFTLTVNPVNDAPTITSIANQTTFTAIATAPLDFTIGDVETAATSLTLSANSSDTTLVPVSNIVFGGSGANRTVTVTPAAGQNGTATITVTVGDGTTTTSTTFGLTVAANTPPTIGTIPNQSITANTDTGPIGFVIGDTETPAANLTVTGSSTNTTLLPNGNIVFGGSGTDRTVTLTPAANQTGTTTVQITVNDGTLTTSRTFTLTVTPNTAPTITAIANQSIAMDTSTAALTFDVADAQTPSVNLTVVGSSSNLTLVPNGNIAISGSGTTRTVTITPTGNTVGTTTITLTVSDGLLSTGTSFVLTVTGTPVQFVGPSFTTQPASQTVAPGTTVTFTASASGSPSPSFQWLKNGTAIPGAIGAALVLSSVTSADAGSYSVMATNSVGSATSSAATLTLWTAPSITAQPQSRITTPGGQVTFTVTATSIPAITYQWRKNGTAISGATNASLVLSNVQNSDAATYDVVVTNSVGSVTSSPAILGISFAGDYFGTLTGGGTWAMHIRSDNTGVYIAHLPDRKSAIVVNFTVDAGGNFTVTSTEIGSGSSTSSDGTDRRTSAAVATFTLTGKITGSQVSGSVNGLDKNFTGVADAPSGPAQALAGFYIAPTLGSTSGSVYSIVGPSGQAFVLAATGVAIDGALGTVGSNGKLTVTSTAGSAVSLTISAQAVTGTYVPPGATAPLAFSGVADTVPITSRLVNLSARSSAGTGSDTLIAGFTVLGSGSKNVLVRGSGPALLAYNVTGVLPDPVLSVYGSGSTAIASNDDWSSATNANDVATTATSLNAFSLSQNSKDAALLTTLSEGVYTAQVTGKAATTGVALVEIYDAAKSASARLVNVSARTRVGTGADVLIVGFAIEGNAPRQLLIRAVGPTLSNFAVTGVLADPQLSIVRLGSSTALLQNDNWGGTAELKAAFTKTQAFALPDASKDAAVLVTLEPGAYSIVVSGVSNTTGVALVELYDIQ